MKDQLQEFFTTPWVAAGAGAIISLRALPGASITEKLVSVGAGFLIAAYCGPALVDYMGWSNPRLAALAIFGSGSVGLVVFSGIVEGIRKTDFGAWLASWLPRKRGDQ